MKTQRNPVGSNTPSVENQENQVLNLQNQITPFHEQISLLKDVVKNQLQALNQQTKQIEALRRMNHQQAKEIENLKSEIRRLKELKTKPKIRSSKMDKKVSEVTDEKTCPQWQQACAKKRITT